MRLELDVSTPALQAKLDHQTGFCESETKVSEQVETAKPQLKIKSTSHKAATS
ncbi:hypothetical protein PC110_g20988 [Phytophthora cactorum]|uniref:Uncharacterized protein n=1 Tax=Phytophthora cactorum TaxID=29920 RepID=A0A329REX2_9STRA|nr:hypothetical protein PC115_g22762 [Phytophthora cactorum]KAG3131059.1 hypothetical protein C6341_g23489 [Phytophthora cactorum]RAW22569.1 hypothetical protein PC110_g20988 [Phytophthora cactorum]